MTNFVKVRIGGHEISLRSTEGEEQTRRIAAFVDRKLKETQLASGQPEQTASLMVMLELANDLTRAQDENTRLRRENRELNLRLNESKDGK